MKLLQIVWKEFKESLKGTLIFNALMVLYLVWITSFFDPDMFKDVEALFANYPEGFKQMVGSQIALTEFGGFMNVYFFSMSWLFFGFYFVMRASQDIPREIENKTIDLILSKPIKRWNFVIGKYFSHVINAIFLVISLYISAIIAIYSFPNIDPAEVNFDELGLAFVLTFLFIVALISTSLLFSTFLDIKKSISVALGLMIFFYVIGVFYETFSEDVQDMKYFSIFYYFDTKTLLVEHDMENLVQNILVLTSYSLTMVALSIMIFNKRDIPV